MSPKKIPAKPEVFDKKYYHNVCFGAEEFKKSGGKKLHPRVKKMIDSLGLTSSMNVLEIGFGRGDTALYIAKYVNSIIGIDYSKDALRIATEIKHKYHKSIQNKVSFCVMNATQLKFKDESFDMIVFIDTLDHLDARGLDKTMNEIRRVLKKDGQLFIRTCSNRILLSYTYQIFIYPINRILTFLDKKMKSASYESLLKDPRTEDAKLQHANEPDYFYLKKLFSDNKFYGAIKTEIGFLSEVKSLKSHVYNFLITLYPLSKIYPLNIFFAYSFTALLKKK